MGHRVLYIEKSKHLNLYLDNLRIETKDGDLTFPINDIQILVIDNYQSKLTIPLINKLTNNNVCTIICGIDHLPTSYILPMNGNYSQSGNIDKQVNWTEDTKGKLQQIIIKGKINNQVKILKENGKDFKIEKKLLEFRDEVELFDSSNREGLAAKMYFREMFGDGFIRFQEDVINAGLNYGYAVFRALIASIIVAKGYLPNLGLFHKGKTNMFNLADDIIEVFRPIVDHWVLNNLSDEYVFKQEHREEIIKLTTQKVIIDKKQQTISNAINIFVDSVLKCIENDDTKYILIPSPILIYDI